MQEVTQRILEAVGGIAGSSLEQTSWLSRSLEVKVQPQVCPEADEPDEADVDVDHDGNFLSHISIIKLKRLKGAAEQQADVLLLLVLSGLLRRNGSLRNNILFSDHHYSPSPF